MTATARWMGLAIFIAAWLIWKPEGLKDTVGPLALFGAQLGLNVSWSWISS